MMRRLEKFQVSDWFFVVCLINVKVLFFSTASLVYINLNIELELDFSVLHLLIFFCKLHILIYTFSAQTGYIGSIRSNT